MHDSDQIFCLHTRAGFFSISVRHFVRGEYYFRICPLITVFWGHQECLGRWYMLIRRVCQILIIELTVPVGQHRLMIISPSVTVRRIRVFTVGTYQLNIMYSYYRRQLSVMISGIRQFLSCVMDSVLRGLCLNGICQPSGSQYKKNLR